MLKRHPLIGRPAEAGLRELVISRGRSGYLALYSYRPAVGVVFVLAIRHNEKRDAWHLMPSDCCVCAGLSPSSWMLKKADSVALSWRCRGFVLVRWSASGAWAAARCRWSTSAIAEFARRL